MSPLPTAKARTPQKKNHIRDVPDVYLEHQKRGEEEFRFWLAGLDLAMLKAIVKVNGFDVTKTSRRWTEPDKFVSLITDQVKARLKRGTAFMTPKSGAEAGGKAGATGTGE